MAAKPVTTWYTICVPLIGPSFGKIRLDGTSTGTVKRIFGTHGPTTGTVRSDYRDRRYHHGHRVLDFRGNDRLCPAAPPPSPKPTLLEQSARPNRLARWR